MTNDLPEIAKAEKIAKAADRLHKLLERSGGNYRTSQQYALLDLCNAMIDFIDDGDCIAQRESLMDDLHCDEDGNPLPADPDNIDDTFWRLSDHAIRAGMGDVL